MPQTIVYRPRGYREPAPLFAPLTLFAAVVALKLYITRIAVLGDRSPLSAIALEGGFVLGVLALVALVLPRHRFAAWVVVDAIVSLLCVAIIVFVQQYENVPTLDALGVAKELTGVPLSVEALLRPSYLLLFADVVGLTIWGVSARRRGVQLVETVFDRRLLAVLAASALWIALVAVPLAKVGGIDDTVAGARKYGLFAYGLFTPASTDDSLAEATASPKSASGSAKRSQTATRAGAGNREAAHTIQPVRSTGALRMSDPVSVQARFESLQGYTGSSRIESAPPTGVAKGHSAIMIQAEALSSWLIGLKVNGREVTPNLNRLVKSSWYAPHMVTQIGRGTTSDAEFIANTSLLSDRSSPSSYLWGSKKIPSLPRLARARGCSALTFHTNVLSFWRRDLLYPALGFTKWYAQPSFPNQDVVDGIGPSDQVLFRKVAQVVEAKRANKSRYLAEIVTLSAHQPYYGAAKRSDLALPKGLAGTELGTYLKAMNYQDEQIGTFLRRLKSDGAWNDTVVVVYGDHFGVRPYKLTNAEQRSLRRLLGRKPSATDALEIPFVMHLPGQTEAATIPRLRAEVDVMPTMADVLGFDLRKTPHIGASIFDDRARRVTLRYYMPDGTFVTDDYLFKPGIGFKDATITPLAAAKSGKVPHVSRTVYEQVHALSAFSKEYLRSLPKLHSSN